MGSPLYSRPNDEIAALDKRAATAEVQAARWQQAARAAKTARQAREEAALLRALIPAEAAERIEQTRAAQAVREAQRAERERAMSHDYEEQHRSAPRHDGPTRGL